MADVRGLVGIDAGVLDQRMKMALLFRGIVAGDLLRGRLAVKLAIDVTGAGDRKRREALQRHQVRDQFPGDRARRSFEPASQLEGHRQRVLAHLQIGRLLDGDLREFNLIFGLKNRAEALAKKSLLFAIHAKPLIFLPILAERPSLLRLRECTSGAHITALPMSDTSSFYITTPIYYVNARPHIGHAYTTVVADAIARRKRAQGFDTWLLTGTDEHGQKIERSARQAGQTPQEFATAVSSQFRACGTAWGSPTTITYGPRRSATAEGVQKLFRVLQERGFIYKGSYTGQYCVSDELYVDAPPGSPCPDCGRITETVSEENYFFKLSAFERKLLELYEQTSGVHPARGKPQRGDFLRAQWVERSVRQPHQLRLGHSGARRSKST